MKNSLLAVALIALCPLARGAENYTLSPDSLPQEGVPKGKVIGPTVWKSKIFEGTTRNYWVYVPAQYDGKTPACVMVFQDGEGYQRLNGDSRVPNVFDNLIHKKEMPVTIGIFINPGAREGGGQRASNRSVEYDTLSDAYSKFLLEEILPEVGREYKLTDDPEGRALCGASSGAICAFTVAWERPDAFRKVVSFVGSFTSIAYRPARDGQPMRPGGDLYPTLIRKNPIKPLKVFLQDGSNDLNNNQGNWFLANQQMLSALEWANANADQRKTEGPRYQVNHAWGEGVHSGKHGGSILPEILRWLWKDYQPKP
jgi:hypothetical protein